MIELTLNYKRKDFEEIYKLEDQLDYIKSPLTKNPFQNLLIAASLFGIVLIFVLNGSGLHIILGVLGIVLLYHIFWYAYRASKVWKKRREIKIYLDKLDSVQKHILILSETHMSLIQDDEKYAEKWSDIKSHTLHELFLFLVSNKETYLFPRKSMTEKDFTSLVKWVKEKTA